MFLIALGAPGLARWDSAERERGERGVRDEFEKLSHPEIIAGGATL